MDKDTVNKFLTQADYAMLMSGVKERPLEEFMRQYECTWVNEVFEIGEECEFRAARGPREWVPARILDYVIEDRSYYVIEYVDCQGRLRDDKVRSSRLRKLPTKQNDQIQS